MKKRAIIALLGITCAIVGCDGTGAGPENQSPIVIGFIDPLELFVTERASLTATDYFSDPDGDLLTYAVMSMDPDNLEASLDGDQVTLLGLGATMTEVTLVASDAFDAKVELSFDVTVIDALRDNFDTDLGWMGVKGLTLTPELVQIAAGQLSLFVSKDYIAHMAVRDIETVGPGWYYSGRLNDTDQVCGGLLAFSIPFVPEQLPQYVWSIDLDPFGGWFASLWVLELGEWFFLAEGSQLPRTTQDADGWEEIGIGLREDGIFYGIANGDFKLFEFDTSVIRELGFDFPITITGIGIGGTPCEADGKVVVDEVEVRVRNESE